MNPRLRRSVEPVSGFGSRLQLAERLLRLGARGSVVCDALGAQGALRSLTRRLYRELRGPARPRGPLPIDLPELLSNANVRLHAALFLDDWLRLRRAGMTRPQALASAWEHLASVCAPVQPRDARLSIDQAWVLACALERDAVVRVACTRCPCDYFDVPAVRRGDSSRAAHAAVVGTVRCPHCCPGRMPDAAVPAPVPAGAEARRTEIRNASALRAASVLREAAPHPLSTFAQQYVWAEAMFRAGARPPIVCRLTGLSMNDTLRQLFVEVVGRGPRQGALPQLGVHVVATYARKLQASVVTVTADRLRRAGYAPAAMVLFTWDVYQALFGRAACFDINAVALIVRARHHPDFALVHCRQCRSSYLELKLDLPGSRCPVCRDLHRALKDAA